MGHFNNITGSWHNRTSPTQHHGKNWWASNLRMLSGQV